MRVFFVIFFILFSTSELLSQDTIVDSSEKTVKYDTDTDVTPIDFSEDKIEQYKNDSEFDYSELEVRDHWWQRFKRWVAKMWRKFWTWLLGDYEANGFLAFLIKALPYLIVAGVVAFIVWLFFRLNPGMRLLKSKETPEVFFTEEEEIIRSRDIRKLIQKALENRDYRLAVRYYYLLILKKLTEARIIEYEFDKTNHDYISEITQQHLSTDFKKVTLLYDYIWYGNFGVTETDYNKAQVIFNNLEHQIPDGDD